MTEEVKPEVTETETQEVTLTPTEERAAAEGWRPKEEWSGDEDDWKDAKTFLRDGELFKKIEEVKRENKNLRAAQNALKGHYEKVKETEYQRAIETLKAQKKAALREGDTDLAVDLDDQIDEKKDELEKVRQIEAAPATPEIHPDFARWSQRNRWYESNVEAREFADSVGMAYKKTHLSATPAEVLAHVEERVAKGYPELFKNPKRNVPSAVEGGTGPRKTSTNFALTDIERQMMNKLVRSGTLTEAQYVKDIQDLEKQGKR